MFGATSSELISLLIGLLAIIIGYYKWSYQYWRRRNLPYLKPQIPFGTKMGPRNHIGVRVKRLYDTMKAKTCKHGGVYFFASPIYVVVDLDYVKNIMAKDFQYFIDRGMYYNEKDDPLSAHLFNISGTKWRNLRTKLTPTFTSGKMRSMFQVLVDCETNLRRKIELLTEKNQPVDIKDVLECFTIDIIGSCAFGLDCKTFEEDDSPFREFGRRIFIRSTLRSILRTFAMNFPTIGRALGIGVIPKDLGDFFMKIVKQTVDYREKNNISRNDFMQLLIDMKNDKASEENEYQHDGNSLTIEEIAAQSFVFFIAGFETSSTTITFALYELAKNQHIQNKLREEIETVLAKYKDKITYDAIMEMKYMNQVLDETLRKYPPGAVLPRKCVKDYKIPDEDIIIEKGTTVLIPVLGIHYDPEYYPDPDKFDPERFTEENKNLRHSYAHIPFGEGPRICIGMRFGLMQSKMGLTSILKNFKLTLNRRTPEIIKYKVNTIVLSPLDEIWLDAQKI